jgi:hypothetical protein
VAQPTNRTLLGFEVQTKKSSQWFWDTNHQTITAGFEGQIGKPSTTLVLKLNQEIVSTDFEAKPVKQSPPVLRPNRGNYRHWFWGQTRENLPSGFEAKQMTNHRP